MAIKKGRRFWTGTEAADIDEYLELLTQEGYPADRFEHSKCRCGSTVFNLLFDADEGCAARQCVSCSNKAFLGDSEENWSDSPTTCRCKCGSDGVEIAVAFSHRDNGDVQWLTVGHRCAKCGMLGSCVNWEIDYGPTDHLHALV